MLKKALSNSSVNALNIHYGLQIFANYIGEVFSGVFLYKAGIPIWIIFIVLAVICGIRIFFRPIAMKLIHKYGLRKVLILGSLCHSALFLILANVSGINNWLLAYVIIASAVDVTYWLPYHTYFAILGDEDLRGKQLGMREAFSYIGGLVAPFVGGFIIQEYGFLPAFILASTFMIFSIVPLFFTKDITIEFPENLKLAFKETKKEGFYLYFGWGIYYQLFEFTWLLVLFILLGDFTTFGGLLSLAVLFQIISVLTVGHFFDKGNAKYIYPIGIVLILAVILGKTFYAYSIPVIIGLDLIIMIGDTFFMPIADAAYYNFSKKTKYPLWFQFFSEIGWDVGVIISSLFASVFLYFGGELRILMPFGAIGVLIIALFLRKYFKNKKIEPSFREIR